MCGVACSVVGYVSLYLPVILFMMMMITLLFSLLSHLAHVKERKRERRLHKRGKGARENKRQSPASGVFVVCVVAVMVYFPSPPLSDSFFLSLISFIHTTQQRLSLPLLPFSLSILCRLVRFVFVAMSHQVTSLYPCEVECALTVSVVFC